MKTIIMVVAMISLTINAMAQSKSVYIGCHPCSVEDLFDKYKKATNTPVQYDHNFINTLSEKFYCDSISRDTAGAMKFICKKLTMLSYKWSRFGELFVSKKPMDNPSEKESFSYELHGIVQNDREPLPGASVAIKGKTTVVPADNKGFFTIKCRPTDTLVFSNAGYVKVEVSVKDYSFMLITLAQDTRNYDPAIVTGYRPVDALANTASVSGVKYDQPFAGTSLFSSLQGQISGMKVTSAGGAPGAMEIPNIGGLTSLGLSQGWNNLPPSAPLIVIDGVPMPEPGPINQLPSMVGDPSANGGGLTYMYTIPPADIESVEVLKGAAATAIYGSRGANGVILIRTRKARQGKAAFSFSASTGIGRYTSEINLMNTRQYLNMRYEAFNNDSIDWRSSNVVANDLKGMDTTRYTDFKKWLLGNTAKINDYSIGWSKGNELFSLLLNGSWHTETSVLPADISGNRRSLTGDFIYHPTKKLTLGLSCLTSHTQNNWTPLNPMYGMLLAPMAPPLLHGDGTLNWGDNNSSFTNPLAVFNNKLVLNTTNHLVHTHGIYSIGNGFKVEVSVGYNSLVNDEKALFPISAYNPALTNTTGMFARARNRYTTWNLEPQLQHNWSNASGGFNMQGILGGSFLSTKNQRLHEILSGYPRDELLGRPGAPDSTSGNNYSLYRYVSLYSRVSIALRQKYLLSVTFRADESSRFGPNNRVAKLGSVGAGWIVRNIDTSKIHHSILSYFKIRGSIGLTGNDMNIGNYGFMNGYVISNGSQLYQGFQSLTPTGLSNPNYQWEYTWKHELAMEMSLFNKSVDVVLSWYLNKSSNLLINTLLPSQTGFNAIAANYDANVLNRGIELEANLHKKWGSLAYEAKLVMAWPRNKLLRFPGLDQSAYSQSLMVGQSLTVERTKKFLGIDPATGEYTAGDSIIAGNHDPKMLGGFTQTFRFNNHWLLQALFEWRNQLATHYMAYTYNYLPPGRKKDGYLMNQPAELADDHWQKPNDHATWQKFSTRGAGATYNAIQNYTASNAQLVNASYVLLRNIRLGYERQKGIFKKWGIQKAFFFLNGENLFMITPYKGPDPQIANPFVVPPLKVITAGISLIF